MIGEMQKRFTLRKIGIFVIAVIGIVMLGLFSQIENWQRDLSTNHASLDAASEDPRMHPPVLAETPTQIADRIATWVQTRPLWSVESQEVSDSQAKIHLTRTTRIFRWVDDIHVTLVTVDGGVRLDAESKSRVGKGDLGQNPRNLRELVAAVQ